MCRLSKMEVCCIGVKGEHRNLTLCMLNCDKNGGIRVNRYMSCSIFHASKNGTFCCFNKWEEFEKCWCGHGLIC